MSDETTEAAVVEETAAPEAPAAPVAEEKEVEVPAKFKKFLN
jgi:hypothetical protein